MDSRQIDCTIVHRCLRGSNAHDAVITKTKFMPFRYVTAQKETNTRRFIAYHVQDNLFLRHLNQRVPFRLALCGTHTAIAEFLLA
ncbi:Uncharacterised protein [Enterobacter cloacae]|nr:Uncharacterised protein [Enterobacter cloacae]